MQSPPHAVGRVSTISSIDSASGSVSPVPATPRLSYVSSTSTASFPQPTTPDIAPALHKSMASLNINIPQRSPPQTERKSSRSSTSLRRVFIRHPKPEAEVSTTTLLPQRRSQAHLQPNPEAASVRSIELLVNGTDTQQGMYVDQVSIASSDQASNAESYPCGPEDVNPWVQERPSADVPVHPQRQFTGGLEVVMPPQQPPIPEQRIVSTHLFLPSEENKYAGFCKGAWKLQIGMKKAMVAQVSPRA